jgi:probable addiction module antidote protein
MMSGRSRSYKDGLYRRLKNNAEAVNYLQAALEDSQPAFLIALKNVLEARNVAAVARASELDRVHIYRMLSEGGNPTLTSLEKILHALGLRLEIGVEESAFHVNAGTKEHVWRLAWHAPEHKPKFAYVQSTINSRPRKPGIIGCVHMLGASADISRSARMPEYEELCEMAC